MESPLIEFKDVTKRFGARSVLERVNLQIYEGQVTTIIGLSGSGKKVDLTFFATDKGDSIFDTVILIDEVTIK